MSSYIASVQEILTMLRATGGRLPYEIGAFVVLQACEAILDRPRRLDPTVVHITEGGEVVVEGASHADATASANSLVHMLAALMVAARSEVPPAFVRIIERPKQPDLRRLRDELEAALLPLNRSASKRVLSRQVRDLLRGDRKPAGELSTREADASLDAWLGIIRHEIPSSEDPVDRARELLADNDPLLEGLEEESRRPAATALAVVFGVLAVLIAAGAYHFLLSR